MKRSVNLIFILILALGLVSCSSEKPLKISTTTWIGYAPLFYAKEKGWLSKINIKLLHVVSLSENIYLYKAGNSDAYVGTQYELSILKAKIPTLMPIILFDRSNGGDLIMSNRSLESLQKSQDPINAYLEMDSINLLVLNDFMKKYHLDESRLNYINRDQAEIKSLKSNQKTPTTVVVTYIPFNSELEKHGFEEIMSTKDNFDLLVVDALFTTTEVFSHHKNKFMALKKFIDDAVVALEKDPKEFYTTVKPYLENISFEEFQVSLRDIEWINKNVSQTLLERMHQASFPTKDLL